MSRIRVITILGSPKSSMKSRNAESLMYERGVITLVSGKVSNVSLISTDEMERRKQAQQALTVSRSEQLSPFAAGSMKVHNDLTIRGENNTFANPLNIFGKNQSTGVMKVYYDSDFSGRVIPSSRPIWIIETDKSNGTMRAYSDLNIRGEKNTFAKPGYIMEKEQSTGALKIYNNFDAWGRIIPSSRPTWIIET